MKENPEPLLEAGVIAGVVLPPALGVDVAPNEKLGLVVLIVDPVPVPGVLVGVVEEAPGFPKPNVGLFALPSAAGLLSPVAALAAPPPPNTLEV